MNRVPLWASKSLDGETMYHYRAREGGGDDVFFILWHHAKHSFEAASLTKTEPAAPEFVVFRVNKVGADHLHAARILPATPHYEPDRLLNVIRRFADLPKGLRAALIQDRNRAKLARRPVAIPSIGMLSNGHESGSATRGSASTACPSTPPSRRPDILDHPNRAF